MKRPLREAKIITVQVPPTQRSATQVIKKPPSLETVAEPERPRTSHPTPAPQSAER